MAEPAAPRYRAFISYSHADARFAGWLHAALEHWAVPRDLVGSAGRFGPVPPRLYPVFRDRDELASASDLPARIDEALDASAALVVVCSRAAAASRWVALEVERFVARHGRERLLCIISPDEPTAVALADCLPLPARQAIESEGLPRPLEPLAADARPPADGRDGALLKLLAGLLGVDLDRLHRRDEQRRRRRRRGVAVAALALIGVLGAAAFYANLRRLDAEAARVRADAAARQERVAREDEQRARTLAEQRQREAAAARDAEAEQRGRAEAARALAEQQRRIADAQRTLAEQRLQVALARQLAAQSQRIRVEQPGELELAALLAVEGVRRFETLETVQALLEVRRVLPPQPRRLGGGSSMAKVAYSADGSLLVVQGADRLEVLRAADAQPLWSDSAGAAREWTLSPDGCCLLSWGDRGGWRWRRAADGADIDPPPAWLQALRGARPGYAGALGFDARGRLFAVGGHVVDLAQGRLLAPASRWAEFSGDGRFVAQSLERQVTVRAADGSEVARFELPQRDMRPLLSRDGALLLVPGGGRVRVFDVAQGRLLFERDCDSPVFTAAFSPTEDRVALSCAAEVLLLDARSGLLTARLPHDRPIGALAFHPGGRWLLTASYDRTARVWDVASGRERWRSPHGGYVADARFAPDGRSVLTGGVEGLRLWPLALEADALAELPGPIGALAAGPDGRWLATTGFEPQAQLHLVDARSGALQRLHTMAWRSEALRFSADGQRLLAGGRDGLHVFDVDAAARLRWQRPAEPGVQLLAAAFGRGDELLLAEGRGSLGMAVTLTRCRLPGGDRAADCRARELASRARGSFRAAFDGAGARLYLWSDDEPPQPVLSVVVDDGAAAPGPRSAPLRAAALAADARQAFAALVAGRRIERLPLPGQPPLAIHHEAWVRQLALSPDGSRLAGALADPVSRGKNRVVLWRSADGAELARFDRPHEDGPLAFGADGRLFYADGTALRAVRWSTGDIVDEVCSRVGRALGCDEWRRWLGDEPWRASCGRVPASPPACPAPAGAAALRR